MDSPAHIESVTQIPDTASYIPSDDRLQSNADHQNGKVVESTMVDDVDRCRICRGEGTKAEELFYPCKCNGSIKYVHQSCLVEWLAHSQKKHCELCKTPFRFTKLYDANMPRSVPVLVFLRQAMLHAWKSLLTYGRFHLVVFVWAMWLPWCMRSVWRGLFWIGDGGWVDWQQRNLEAASLDGLSTERSKWSKVASASLSAPHTLASLIMSRFSNSLERQGFFDGWAIDYPYHEPVSFQIFKNVYHSIFDKSTQGNVTPSAPIPMASANSSSRPPSWLSDVGWLTSLTTSQTVNNVIIDTLEGQIITMFVVVIFIVIFLIREWVMQQQQNILFPMAPENLNERQRGDNQGERAQHEDQPDQIDRANEGGGPRANRAQRILLQPRGRLQRRATHPDGVNLHDPADTGPSRNVGHDAGPAMTGRQTDDASPSRPAMPGRGYTSAVEIRRNLDEGPPGPDSEARRAGAQKFKDLWSRANEDPSEVLRIIQNEQRSGELDFIVPFMKQLDEALAEPSDTPRDTFAPAGEEEAYPSPPASSGAVTSSSMSVAFGSRPRTPNLEAAFDISPVSPADRLFPHHRVEDHPEIWHLDSPELVDQPADSRPTSQGEPNQVLALPPHTALLDEPDSDAGDDHDDIGDVKGEATSPATSVETDSTAEPNHRSDATETAAQEPWIERLMRVMWDLADAPNLEHEQALAEPEEHVVNNLADEAPFVPAARRHPLLPAPDPQPDAAGDRQDGEVIRDLDGNPVDALDDVEDMEGFMELIGMQGPIFGLVQNGMFCAALVSISIIAAIWLPYIFGKGFIIFIARPVHVLEQPLRFFSTLADMIVDFGIFTISCSYYWTDRAINFVCSPIRLVSPGLWKFLSDRTMSNATRKYAENALGRLIEASMANSGLVANGFDIPRFSIVAHHSLFLLRDRIQFLSATILNGLIKAIEYCGATNISIGRLLSGAGHRASNGFAFFAKQSHCLLTLMPAWRSFNPFQLTIPINSPHFQIDYRLAAWDAQDRSVAILFGYIFVMLAGMLYLRVAASIKGTNRRAKVEGIVADLLYQAGGVTKVILIISIEMIVFPLYCGIILDIALLPLFKDASVLTRIYFAKESPNASAFMHWFVGTCYMFHFALFVAMCRKIFRKGVLFFIRDPDDPTFHPVRDVLERNVATQLYKISFSALVYGVLILACLGGVVWGIAFGTRGIFPIKWTSNEPLIEFPFDLLFYNILIPVAIKYCKPANAFSTTYGWWYHKCAKWLHLSSFLFGEDCLHDGVLNKRATWREWADKVKSFLSRTELPQNTHTEHQSPSYPGKFAQVPFSDQLRIPKGVPTFFEVEEVDDIPVNVDQRSKHFLSANSESFTKVYIPPNFRLRIATLTALIWLFSAALGLSSTILPLTFGRFLLAMFAPSELRLNDTYAFALGFYLLGGALFAGHKAYVHRAAIRARLRTNESTIRTTLARAGKLFLRALGLLYTYAAFAIVLPALASLITQAYFVLPIFTFLETNFPESSSLTTKSGSNAILSESVLLSQANTSVAAAIIPPSVVSDPMIHIIQEWTLGLLYIKALGRIILWSTPSRPATALRAIIRDGWFAPDAGLATRGFIIPAMLLVTILLAFPLACGWVAARTVFAVHAQNDEVFLSCIYRYSYPAVLGTGVAMVVMIGVIKALKAWRKKVRDEVYLIGERLHNYGDKRKSIADAEKRIDKGKGKERDLSADESAGALEGEQHQGVVT